jgi:FtsP/CotA-like multicopper oxidase with cupredoxin domain
VRTYRLTAAEATLDLGGRSVPSWAYDETLPGPLLRVTAGDVLDMTLANRLPASTTLHCHGVRLRCDMDGVPGLTQAAIRPGSDFRYRFTVGQPGTYLLHSHVGVQADRALYAPLVVDDPREPLTYDKEWVVVLDDWLDGVEGSTPEEVLDQLGATWPWARAAAGAPAGRRRRSPRRRGNPRAPRACCAPPTAACCTARAAASPTPGT